MGNFKRRKGLPHPTLIGGENPQVLTAGMVDIISKIYSINNFSGHFKPTALSLESMQNAFNLLPSQAFKNDFQGFIIYKEN
jgi:hypothetical protein